MTVTSLDSIISNANRDQSWFHTSYDENFQENSFYTVCKLCKHCNYNLSSESDDHNQQCELYEFTQKRHRFYDTHDKDDIPNYIRAMQEIIIVYGPNTNHSSYWGKIIFNKLG